MGDVVDLAAARSRRGLTPVPTDRFFRRKRPTLQQAVAEYDEATFRRAYVIDGSTVAHDVEFVMNGRGAARCGSRHGALTQPHPQTRVCLRCWPWWRP